MSNLESIVPPLELCKKIPAGEFEDSALVWDIHGCEIWRLRENVSPACGYSSADARGGTGGNP